MPSFFEQVKNDIFPVEGAYSDCPNDHGGETKYGISKAAYPSLDIKNLTWSEALRIYKRDYWDFYRVGEINNQSLANEVFDMLINSRPTNAAKCLQLAINCCGGMVEVDGLLGSETIEGANNINNSCWLIDRYRLERVIFYTRLVEVDVTQRGMLLSWVKRAAI